MASTSKNCTEAGQTCGTKQTVVLKVMAFINLNQLEGVPGNMHISIFVQTHGSKSTCHGTGNWDWERSRAKHLHALWLYGILPRGTT